MLPGVSFDALVVLGCRVDGGALAHAALRRVERAAQAYAEHGSALVIASGGKTWQGFMECDVFAAGLAARGVPEERLARERESLTTRGNARCVVRLLRGRALGRVGVVTCDWHMPRALRLFRRLGLRVEPVPAVAPSVAPSLPRREQLARTARERASLALDLVLAPLWSRP
jgi:uncharacterized SAM-binding protein YcdF (DUF218 family)